MQGKRLIRWGTRVSLMKHELYCTWEDSESRTIRISVGLITRKDTLEMLQQKQNEY
jgi:hypothetical protein